MEQYAKEDQPMFDAFDDLTDEQKKLMELYHLDDLREEGTGKLLRFKCTGISGMREGCGLTYETIEDRMLRGPETCSGCFIRMGHG